MTVQVKHISKSKWTRSGSPKNHTLAVVIHYFGNPMQTAEGCWKFFNDRNDGNYGSAHYIIGLKGEIIQAVPENEVAYHCGSSTLDPDSQMIYTNRARRLFDVYAKYPDKLSPNQVSIGIECAHINAAGEMTAATLDSLVELTADLCKRYNLDPFMEVVTHKDVVGWKDCHKWFVDNPDCFYKFQCDVQKKMEENK